MARKRLHTPLPEVMPELCVSALDVDSEGTIVADVFSVEFEGEVLIDCDGEDASASKARLVDEGLSVEAVSSDWRVFAELPHQVTVPDGSPFIRVSDPRRLELGARIYLRAERLRGRTRAGQLAELDRAGKRRARGSRGAVRARDLGIGQ
jgi:hypothetical protein